jgi:hypothetical protein
MTRKSENKSAAKHIPGSKHILPDGTQYIVAPTGAWKRVTPRPALMKDHGDHNNGVRRRGNMV